MVESVLDAGTRWEAFWRMYFTEPCRLIFQNLLNITEPDVVGLFSSSARNPSIYVASIPWLTFELFYNFAVRMTKDGGKIEAKDVCMTKNGC